MANSLLGSGNKPNNDFMNQIKMFAQNNGLTNDIAKQKVQELLNNGKMTQEQLNVLTSKAKSMGFNI